MLFKIMFYHLKLITHLKHIIFDIIIIFLCMKLSSCTVTALLNTVYFGLGLTVCSCLWCFFSQKYFFSINDMLFLNAYFSYIMRYFQGFEDAVDVVSRHN